MRHGHFLIAVNYVVSDDLTPMTRTPTLHLVGTTGTSLCRTRDCSLRGTGTSGQDRRD